METGMRSARGAIPLILWLGLVAPAWAQNKKAEALNDEGKDLYSEKKDFEGAAAKFRQAIAISPDPRYYFNLCSALDRLELYDQALEACDGVFAHKPRADLAQKTGAKAAEIRQRMKGGEPEPEPKPPEPPPPKTETGKPPPPPIKPSDPALPQPSPATPYRGAYETAAQKDSSTYGWGLGVAIAAMRHNYDHADFKRAGFGIKIAADFQILSKLHMGLEPYLQFSSFQNENQSGSQQDKPLSIFDIGVAWFWHVRLGTSNFYFTPSVGVSASFLNPQGYDVSYLTAGIRLEAALDWVIANRHVISLGSAFTIYPPGSQVTGTRTDLTTVQLDGTGSTFAVLLGYTYRFDYGWIMGLPLE
jgi:hypothetical protein